jgi:NarL family two-component system response regulator LiaR
MERRSTKPPARVRLLKGSEEVEEGGAPTASELGAEEDVQSLTLLDLTVCDAAIREQEPIAGIASFWPGLPDAARRQAEAEGIGGVLATPLTGTSGPAGALVVVRDSSAGEFSVEDRELAGTVGEALAAVIEIDRLHRKETRQAAAEERQALARDLHDAVTQSLYSASLIAEALPAVWERDPDEGERNLERLRRLVRAALAEMRTLLFELRPAALETAPLDALVERLGDALAGQAQIDVDIEVADVDLPSGVKIAFYRVTQEAFSNIAKHARRRRRSHPHGAGRRTRLRPGHGAERPHGAAHHERTPGTRGRLAQRGEQPWRGDGDPRDVAADRFGRATTGHNGSVTHNADIRVMIVDDHQMVREGLKVLLSTCDDIAVVGEAADGAEAVDLCLAVRPDVVLMDVMMPVMDGAEATAEITAAFPDVRVIALTSFVDQDYVEKALDAGAISYLLKDARPDALTQAIRDAVEGRGTIDSSAMRALMARRQDDEVGRELTVREREVLRLLAAGMSNKEIADDLTLSVGTVRLHVSNILSKLGAPNRTTAAAIAMKHGLA